MAVLHPNDLEDPIRDREGVVLRSVKMDNLP